LTEGLEGVTGGGIRYLREAVVVPRWRLERCCGCSPVDSIRSFLFILIFELVDAFDEPVNAFTFVVLEHAKFVDNLHHRNFSLSCKNGRSALEIDFSAWVGVVVIVKL